MSRFLIAIGGMVLALYSTAASAAEIYISDDKRPVITLKGKIEFGDEMLFRDVLDEVREAYPGGYVGLILESDGGNLHAALNIADTIKREKIATYARKRCASACALLFFAGATRGVTACDLVGIHRANARTEDRSFEVNTRMVDALMKYGVPWGVAKNALSTANDAIYWLTLDDMERSRVVVAAPASEKVCSGRDRNPAHSGGAAKPTEQNLTPPQRLRKLLEGR